MGCGASAIRRRRLTEDAAIDAEGPVDHSCSSITADSSASLDVPHSQPSNCSSSSTEPHSFSVRQLCNFFIEIQQDLNTYCLDHLVGNHFEHICRQSMCQWDHFGIRHVEWIARETQEHVAFSPMQPNMHIVVVRYIKPRSRAHRCSFARVLNPGPAVAPQVFISHCWNEVFGEFVATIQLALPDDTLIWVCSFTIDQNADVGAQLGTSLYDSPFAVALRAADHVVMVVDAHIEPLTRIWCVYELYLAHKLQKHVRLQAAIMSDEFWQRVEIRTDRLKVSECKASNQEDFQKIMSEVGSSCIELDRAVRELVKKTRQSAEGVEQNILDNPNHQRDDRYFLYVAMKPQIVMTSHVPSRIAMINRLEELETALKTTKHKRSWKEAGMYPVAFSDADVSKISQDLRAGRIEHLLWSAAGCGWEAPSTPEAATLEVLENAIDQSPSPPRSVIVVMCYGSRTVAESLFCSGVQAAIWIQADLLDEVGQALFTNVLVPALEAMHGGAILEQVVKDIIQNARPIYGEGWNLAGFHGAQTVLPRWIPSPLSTDDWLQNIASPLLHESNLLCEEELREFVLLAEDLRHAEELRVRISSTRCLAVRGQDTTSSSCRRCCAVALHAGAAYVTARGRFHLVYRVATELHLQDVENILSTMPCDVPILVWADFIADSNLSQADLEQEILTIMRSNPNAHAILTSDQEDGGLQSFNDSGFAVQCIELVALDISASSRLDSLHLDIKIFGELENSGGYVDLLKEFAIESLRVALTDVLPGHQRPIAAIYVDDCMDPSGLRVRISVSDIGFLQNLRDQVLSQNLEASLTQRLPVRDNKQCEIERGQLLIRLDLSAFAERYESSMLALEYLTPHQQMVLSFCDVDDDVHLFAPAGAGKTFVAMAHILQMLKQGTRVLFVARNPALAHAVASWLCMRMKQPFARRRALGFFHALFDPMSAGTHACNINNGRIDFGSASADVMFGLIVVDEAHHIYSNPNLRSIVESYTQCGGRRLLLSDISQSVNRDPQYPDNLVQVSLVEVVRSTQRIVAGAAAFQIGGTLAQPNEKLNPTGPPLKSFVFDESNTMPLDSFIQSLGISLSRKMGCYVWFTLRAMDELVLGRLNQMSLHNRLALLVPDATFAEAIQPGLERALKKAFPHRCFRLVTAVEISAFLPGDTHPEDVEWLVIDSVENFDGLERLIVIAIGLDTFIEDSNAFGSRSMLYRALTRAQMLVIIVNELIQGGWLEFLGRLDLAPHGFSNAGCKAGAAEHLVTKHVSISNNAEQSELQQGKRIPPEAAPASKSGTTESPAIRLLQDVWDTCGNAIEDQTGSCRFMPFWERRPSPQQGSPEWEAVRDEILAACGLLPDQPNLTRLRAALQRTDFSGIIDEYTDERGSTPLMFCVGPVNADTFAMVFELVVKQKANPKVKNRDGASALSFARAWRDRAPDVAEADKVVKLLIDMGADPSDHPAF